MDTTEVPSGSVPVDGTGGGVAVGQMQTTVNGLSNEDIRQKLQTRNEKRKAKEWETADKLKAELKSMGVEIREDRGSRGGQWTAEDGRSGTFEHNMGTFNFTASLSTDKIDSELERRNQARLKQDWKEADSIKDFLRQNGVEMDDKQSEWKTLDGRTGCYGRRRGKRPSGHTTSFMGGQLAPAIQLDKGTLSLSVPNEYIGVVIGKQGSNIKAVEDKTGARVMVSPETATATGQKNPMRNITITGEGHGPQMAVDAINELIKKEEHRKNLSNPVDIYQQQPPPRHEDSRYMEPPPQAPHGGFHGGIATSDPYYAPSGYRQHASPPRQQAPPSYGAPPSDGRPLPYGDAYGSQYGNTAHQYPEQQPAWMQQQQHQPPQHHPAPPAYASAPPLSGSISGSMRGVLGRGTPHTGAPPASISAPGGFGPVRIATTPGLGLSCAEVTRVLCLREQARRKHDWATADAIKDQLRAEGVHVQDKEKTWSLRDGRNGRVPMPDDETPDVLTDDEIIQMLTNREEARKHRKWDLADSIQLVLRRNDLELSDKDTDTHKKHTWASRDGTRKGSYFKEGISAHSAPGGGQSMPAHSAPRDTGSASKRKFSELAPAPAFVEGQPVPIEFIKQRLHDRNEARKLKDWNLADAIKDELRGMGVHVHEDRGSREATWDAGDGRRGTFTSKGGDFEFFVSGSGETSEGKSPSR